MLPCWCARKTKKVIEAMMKVSENTTVAALPSASNVSLLAERYQADNGRIARIIMTSTVLSFASFTSSAVPLRFSAGKLASTPPN